MDWLSFLYEVGAALITAIVGVVGIGGTVWGVRHQTRTQAIETLRSEQRATYAELLVVAYAAMDLLPEDADPIQNWGRKFDQEQFDQRRNEAVRLAARCAVLGGEDVRWASSWLARSLGHASRAMAFPLADLGTGPRERNQIEEAADEFLRHAQASINRTDRNLKTRLRRLRIWWLDRHERRTHRHLEDDLGELGDGTELVDGQPRRVPEDE